MNLPEMSAERRSEILAMARVARVAKVAERAANKHLLKLEYVDAAHWIELAQKYNVKRLPSKEEGVDKITLRKWLGKLDIPQEVFVEHYTSMSYFVKHNPKWTKWAAVGLLLELKDELHAA